MSLKGYDEYFPLIEGINIGGFIIEVAESFPPDSNPFLHDHVRMGTDIGSNLMAMMSNHVTKSCGTVVLVDKPTGKRILIVPPSVRKDSVSQEAKNMAVAECIPPGKICGHHRLLCPFIYVDPDGLVYCNNPELPKDDGRNMEEVMGEEGRIPKRVECLKLYGK